MNPKPNPTAKKIQPSKQSKKQPEPKGRIKTITYSGGDVRTAKVIPNKPKDAYFKGSSEGRAPSKIKGKKLVQLKSKSEMWTGSMCIDRILMQGMGFQSGKLLRVSCLDREPTFRDILQILQTLSGVSDHFEVTFTYKKFPECIESLEIELDELVDTKFRAVNGDSHDA